MGNLLLILCLAFFIFHRTMFVAEFRSVTCLQTRRLVVDSCVIG